MPKMLALMAVQRQTAASRLARPWSKVQQGVTGGVPTTTWTKPNKSAHTPSFRVSTGQLAFAGGGLCGCGFGLFGDGGQGTLCEVTMVKKRRLRERRRAMLEEALEAIFKHTGYKVLLKTAKRRRLIFLFWCG